MSLGETACSYALLILEDDKIAVIVDNITTLLESAKVEVESYWSNLFFKLVEKKNIKDLIASALGDGAPGAVAAAPAAAGGTAVAAPVVEEKKSVVPLNTWVLISNFKLAYNLLRRADRTFNRELAEFLDRKVPANTIPVDGVFSFDHVDRNTRLFNRVYQPAPENVTTWGIIELEKPLSITKIVPVIIFFHGGSFSHSSANSAIYDTFCRRLVTMCKDVVVSVNYRRSPEHRFPCAYEDSWNALNWVKSRTWLQSGKDSKVYVYMAGDSSGGNIVHHVAARAAEEDVEVLGNILLHPLFGGEKRTESEKKLDGNYFVRLQDRDWYWRAFLPEGEDREHPACNPFGSNGKSLEGLKFPKSLVCVAGLDLLQDWQLEYVEGLKNYDQDVKLLYLKEATIGFYFLPNNDHFYCLMNEINTFVHPNC